MVDEAKEPANKKSVVNLKTKCTERQDLAKVNWLIEYYLKLNEEITRRILNSRLHAIIALGFGLIAIPLLGLRINSFLLAIATAFYLIPLVVVIILVTRTITSSNYVIIHKNPWKYFYYGNPHILQIDINTHSKESEEAYEKGFSLFVNNFKTESEEVELENALRHAYNLQVLNYYKNRYYLKIRKAELYWCWCALISVVIILCSLLV